jgi:hypothetical protein
MCGRAIARRTTQHRTAGNCVLKSLHNYSTSVPLQKANSLPSSKPIDPRWLSDLKERIGKCITFGLNPSQLDEAGSILQQLGSGWTELVVGNEGYLTAPGRIGLDKQAVVWGEMVQYLYFSVHLAVLTKMLCYRTQWYALHKSSIWPSMKLRSLRVPHEDIQTFTSS